MKICDRCELPKPITNFVLRSKKGWVDGIPTRSKTCRKCLRLQRNASGKCQCGNQLVTGTRCQSCKDLHAKTSAARRQELKRLAMSAYGNCCAYCGENRLIFLTIDHINNDGAEHRRLIGPVVKTVGRASGSSLYRWLNQKNYPPGFQAACFNCNGAKAIVGDEELKRIRAIERLTAALIMPQVEEGIANKV